MFHDFTHNIKILYYRRLNPLIHFHNFVKKSGEKTDTTVTGLKSFNYFAPLFSRSYESGLIIDFSEFIC